MHVLLTVISQLLLSGLELISVYVDNIQYSVEKIISSHFGAQKKEVEHKNKVPMVEILIEM